MEWDRDVRVLMAALMLALLACAEDTTAGSPDASGRASVTPFDSADAALADATAVDVDGASSDSPDSEAPAEFSPGPFLCKTAEPCGVLVAVPGDCSARMLLPCSEREESSLAQRLLRSCGYEPSYNPLELSFEAGCVTTFRYAENSKTDRREVVDCLLKELGALRFDCAGGGRLLLYHDTLALP